MSDEALTLKAALSGVLVKWDASVGNDIPDGDPTKHPACIEVIRLEEGKDPEILYRRD